MPAPRVIQPVLKPTVEIAYERFEAEWPAVWRVYGDDANGWKDRGISRVYVRIDGYRYLTGDARFREYQVRAIKVETAIERAVELIASPYALFVTVYKVQLPPSEAMVGYLTSVNAKLQRNPEFLAAVGRIRAEATAVAAGVRPRALGPRSRAGGNRSDVSPKHRRPMSVGVS